MYSVPDRWSRFVAMRYLNSLSRTGALVRCLAIYQILLKAAGICIGLALGMGASLSAAVPSCVDLSGDWNVAEEVTVTQTVGGESDTDHQSGTGSVQITQTGCQIQFYSEATSP